MQHAPEIGLPTRVPYMRLILNPNFVERTPPLLDPNTLWVHINGAYDEIRAALRRAGTAASAAAPAATQSWTAKLLEDLERNTCKGIIAPGTNSRIRRYPTPDELERARDSLASQGIKFEINPYADEDGSFRVWVEYDRTFAAGF